jgi:hypothetical protein
MCSLNNPFLKVFSQNKKGPTMLIKTWWVDEEKISRNDRSLSSHKISRHHTK